MNENGCRICGVTNDILKDPARRADLSLNQYGALQLETHHYVIEWALANAIDPDKFNRTALTSSLRESRPKSRSGNGRRSNPGGCLGAHRCQLRPAQRLEQPTR